jgi:hypothetical protein
MQISIVSDSNSVQRSKIILCGKHHVEINMEMIAIPDQIICHESVITSLFSKLRLAFMQE